jgi:hypothetical protein
MYFTQDFHAAAMHIISTQVNAFFAANPAFIGDSISVTSTMGGFHAIVLYH